MVKALDGGQPVPGMGELLPYSVVLENRTPESIRAATLSWTVKPQNDFPRSAVNIGLVGGPERGDEGVLGPHEQLVVTPGGRILTWVPNFGGGLIISDRILRSLPLVTAQEPYSLEIAIDIVIFGSGRAIGPDRSRTRARLLGEEAPGIGKSW